MALEVIQCALRGTHKAPMRSLKANGKWRDKIVYHISNRDKEIFAADRLAEIHPKAHVVDRFVLYPFSQHSDGTVSIEPDVIIK